MTRFASWVVVSVLLFGCSKNEFGPVATSAAEHPAYAAQYPERLEETNKLYSIEKGFASEIPAELKQYPDALNEPDWDKVKQTYVLADQDGKSAHYAEVRSKNADVAGFFVEEKEEIVQKVNGGVQYQADQKKCDAQFYGSIDRGLEKGVKERFEEREEEASRAQAFITENEDTLKKENVDKLREQAKQVAAAANLVYISLAERHQKLEELASQGEDVDRTIEKRLEEIRASSPEGQEEQEALKEERTELLEARKKIRAAVEGAKSRLQTSEDEIKAARKAYEDAFSALLEDVDKRKASAGK